MANNFCQIDKMGEFISYPSLKNKYKRFRFACKGKNSISTPKSDDTELKKIDIS